MIVNMDAAFRAFITVTYLSGTCTLSLGSTSYSHTGGGTHTFAVNRKGTWTVSAVDGSSSVSKSVEISYRAQAEAVTLSYSLAIFDGGDNTALTGGWKNIYYFQNPTLSVGSSLSISSTNAQVNMDCGVFVHTNNKINLSDLSNIEITLSAFKQSASEYKSKWKFGAIASLPSSIDLVNALNLPSFAASTMPTSTGTKSFDVSGLSGSYYLAFYVAYRNGSANITATKIIGN